MDTDPECECDHASSDCECECECCGVSAEVWEKILEAKKKAVAEDKKAEKAAKAAEGKGVNREVQRRANAKWAVARRWRKAAEKVAAGKGAKQLPVSTEEKQWFIREELAMKRESCLTKVTDKTQVAAVVSEVMGEEYVGKIKNVFQYSDDTIWADYVRNMEEPE